MGFKADWHRDKFKKKLKRGFSGYPVATIAYYGPTNVLATKVSVGIIAGEDDEVTALERWKTEGREIRSDPKVLEEVLGFISRHGAKTVVATDRIIGCPHEEGIDYPEGEYCPECTYWIGRERFTGNIIH